MYKTDLHRPTIHHNRKNNIVLISSFNIIYTILLSTFQFRWLLHVPITQQHRLLHYLQAIKYNITKITMYQTDLHRPNIHYKRKKILSLLVLSISFTLYSSLLSTPYGSSLYPLPSNSISYITHQLQNTSP